MTLAKFFVTDFLGCFFDTLYVDSFFSRSIPWIALILGYDIPVDFTSLLRPMYFQLSCSSADNPPDYVFRRLLSTSESALYPFTDRRREHIPVTLQYTA